MINCFDNLITNYSLDIPYDFNSESIDNTLNVNQFSHSLPTDVGYTSTNLVVTRKDNSTIMHNENVNYTLQTKHKLTTLSLPVNVKYSLLNKKNSSFSVIVGPTFEYQLSSSVRSELLQSHHSDISTHSISLIDQKIDKNVGVGFNLGTEYALKINETLEFGLSVNYTELVSKVNRSNRNNLTLVIRKNIGNKR